MNKYVITHKDIAGDEIEIHYNAAGRLLKFDATNASGFNPTQIQYLKAQVPVLLADPLAQFTELINNCKGKIDITESAFDVSFETFWEAYDNKRHRKPAEQLFNKLSYTDKVKCIESCKDYHKYRNKKGEWLQQQLPDTYIRQREFETQWSKIK